MSWLKRLGQRIASVVKIEHSGPSHKEWSCKRKMRYGSYATVMKAIDAQKDKAPLGWYHCRFCDGYHVYNRNGD